MDVKEVSQNEYDALCISLDKVLLKKRFTIAKKTLSKEYRRMFNPGIYKPSEKRLYSDAPFGYVLQWRTRRYPDQPESYDNQQTAIGSVYLYKLADKEKTEVEL